MTDFGTMSSEVSRDGSQHGLTQAWLGDSEIDIDGDFEFRPGESSGVHADDPVAIAAARQFRQVMGRFASGVAVVTGSADGEPVGLTCQSFASVSLDPPLVLFAPAKTSRAWPLIQRSGHFCVNFLAERQTELSDTMASRGIDKFADVEWSPSPATGSPVLADVLGYVDCMIHAVHEAGDHYVVIGRVLDLAAAEAGAPLLYFEGEYRAIER